MSDWDIYWAHERAKLLMGLYSLASLGVVSAILWVWFSIKERLDRRKKSIKPPASPLPPRPPKERL